MQGGGGSDSGFCFDFQVEFVPQVPPEATRLVAITTEGESFEAVL